MNQNYQLVIIGGGPAGLTAGLYASRARLHTLLIEKGMVGGQIANAERVENYPGFPEGIGGYELGQLIFQQATKYGLETIAAEVEMVAIKGEEKVVTTTEGDYTAEAVIIAGGSEWQKLGLAGEESLTGRGVSYCATCDAPLFRDQIVAVVGGGDAALTEAISLTKFAAKVVIIHRRRELRASKILQEMAFAEPKIEVIWDTVVEEIEGETELKAIKLRHVKSGEISTYKLDGIFIAIGFRPYTAYLRGLLNLDNGGHIITNGLLETNVAGIFAAGDIRHNSAKQAITAAGDGAMAALSAERFLRELGQ